MSQPSINTDSTPGDVAAWFRNVPCPQDEGLMQFILEKKIDGKMLFSADFKSQIEAWVSSKELRVGYAFDLLDYGPEPQPQEKT